jgi:hypothetical protein
MQGFSQRQQEGIVYGKAASLPSEVRPLFSQYARRANLFIFGQYR